MVFSIFTRSIPQLRQNYLLRIILLQKDYFDNSPMAIFMKIKNFTKKKIKVIGLSNFPPDGLMDLIPNDTVPAETIPSLATGELTIH